jgi:hypothetical protein
MQIIEVKTNQIISDMRNSKLELTADYIQAMSDRIAALEAGLAAQRESEAELWNRAITAAALKAQDAADYLMGDDNTGALNTAVNIRDRINVLKRTTPPEAETHLFTDRGDGRCETCGHALFATHFIHEVKGVAPPLGE